MILTCLKREWQTTVPKRRMFTLDIVDSDAFLDMPLSTQALYFHLAMRADDDGFIDKSKRIMRAIGSSDDDLKLLLHKNFVIPFEDGVCVIKHWRMHNYIRNDRYKETNYIEKKSSLGVKDNGSYTLKSEVGMSLGSGLVDAGKVRLGKGSIGSNTLSSKHDHVYREVIDYLNEKAETKFKPTSRKTQSLIKARLNENFAVDDFKTVIDNKVADWNKNADMRKYLRPETLFGTKFESYLNQTEVKSDIEWFDQYKKGKS